MTHEWSQTWAMSSVPMVDHFTTLWCSCVLYAHRTVTRVNQRSGYVAQHTVRMLEIRGGRPQYSSLEHEYGFALFILMAEFEYAEK